MNADPWPEPSITARIFSAAAALAAFERGQAIEHADARWARVVRRWSAKHAP